MDTPPAPSAAEDSAPPISPPPAYSAPPLPSARDLLAESAPEVVTHTAQTQLPPPPPPPKIPESTTNAASTKSTKGKAKCGGKDPAPKAMGWGWTSAGAGAGGKSSSGFRRKKGREEQVVPAMQWSGDGKQETGVLPLDGDGEVEEEPREGGDATQARG